MKTTRVKNMDVIQVEDYAEMSKVAADIVLEKLKKIKQPVLGLATGSTPEGLYALMRKAYEENGVSFRDVTTFNLDEYIGLAEENEQSYHYFMNDKLLNHIDIPERSEEHTSELQSRFDLVCRL